jgi:hypothetical protein
VPLLPADKVDAVDAVIANLQVERYPLLEKLNVFLLYQKWYQGKRLVPAAEAISKKCWAFVAGEESREYRRAYGHFALDMLAQLFRQYKRPCLPIYCGLPSFVQMSAGVPRNALLIMQNAFKWASFNGEQPFASAPVSGATQWEALLESSVFFEEEEARPGEEVPDIRQCIGRLAEFLRAVRFASKPVEVSPLAFSTDAAALTQTAKRNLELAENWSFLFRDNRGRPNKNSNQIDPKYQLNPMLSPKWELPIAVRGDVWLPPRLAIAIFDSAESGSFKERMEEVVSRYMAPEFGKKAGSLVLTTSPLFPDAPD